MSGTGSTVFQIGFLASICISLADTGSSDIGIYFRQKTYDIITFKPLQSGLSGGVSFAGTFAGCAGSIIFSLF
ncbi:MAG: DUF92 domain-containing protein [Saprospiraceae bacterium]|nr:DUF92 domain-containing protein [Saprospiraceae bacterium]MBL0027060.1 DUF92 domain-containing protein [Saprospiraceae bacterium]